MTASHVAVADNALRARSGPGRAVGEWTATCWGRGVAAHATHPMASAAMGGPDLSALDAHAIHGVATGCVQRSHSSETIDPVASSARLTRPPTASGAIRREVGALESAERSDAPASATTVRLALPCRPGLRFGHERGATALCGNGPGMTTTSHFRDLPCDAFAPSSKPLTLAEVGRLR